VAQPVALVPVPRDPGPGVFRRLAVHQQRPLERLQPVENGPAIGAAGAIADCTKTGVAGTASFSDASWRNAYR
jgi:hypothetical protein